MCRNVTERLLDASSTLRGGWFVNEDRLRTLLRGFHLNEGASSGHISDTEKQLRIEFPEDYRESCSARMAAKGLSARSPI